ncbi:bacteriohemerythrin [Magnetococcales bacterium HHB-1]
MNIPTSKLKWSQAYSVGVEAMDQQHQQLFKTINDLIDLCQREVNEQHLHVMSSFFFLEVFGYIKTHFQDEVRLLKKHGYPDLALHQKQHDDIEAAVIQLQQKFNQTKHIQKKHEMLVEVIHFMFHWVEQHVRKEDRDYGIFLNRQGIF